MNKEALQIYSNCLSALLEVSEPTYLMKVISAQVNKGTDFAVLAQCIKVLTALDPGSRAEVLVRLSKDFDVPQKYDVVALPSASEAKALAAVAVKKQGSTPKWKLPEGQTLKSYALSLGIPFKTLYSRWERGMSLEEASRPQLSSGASRKYELPEGKTIQALADEYKLNPNTLLSRLQRGLSWEEAVTRPLSPTAPTAGKSTK